MKKKKELLVTNSFYVWIKSRKTEVGFPVRTIFLLFFYFVKQKIRKVFLLFRKTFSTPRHLLAPAPVRPGGAAREAITRNWRFPCGLSSVVGDKANTIPSWRSEGCYWLTFGNHIKLCLLRGSRFRVTS